MHDVVCGIGEDGTGGGFESECAFEEGGCGQPEGEEIFAVVFGGGGVEEGGEAEVESGGAEVEGVDFWTVSLGATTGGSRYILETLSRSFCSSSSKSLARNVVSIDLSASSTKPTASDRLLYSDLVTLSEKRSISKRASIPSGTLKIGSFGLVVISDQS